MKKTIFFILLISIFLEFSFWPIAWPKETFFGFVLAALVAVTLFQPGGESLVWISLTSFFIEYLTQAPIFSVFISFVAVYVLIGLARLKLLPADQRWLAKTAVMVVGLVLFRIIFLGVLKLYGAFRLADYGGHFSQAFSSFWLILVYGAYAAGCYYLLKRVRLFAAGRETDNIR